MKKLFGIEANYIIEEVPEFVALIKEQTKIIDFHDQIFLFEKQSEAEKAEHLLKEVNLFENKLHLLLINEGEKGETFFDFGMESEDRNFLFIENLCAFCIEKGDPEAVEMAVFQFQEHLVFTAENEKPGTIYFSERHLQDLIKGIADAYDIQVSFLDLDK